MDQRIEALDTTLAERLAAQRKWVREHYTPETEHQFGTVEGKLRLLEVILANRWVAPDETLKLQSLGVAFGDALAQQLGMTWVAVEDEYGRDPALRFDGTSILAFPLTTISKRVEGGEEVNVRQLFEQACAKLREVRHAS
jgi:hypothetical protein